MVQLKRSHWVRTGLVLLYLVNVAFALDPDRQMSQYTRQRWGTENDFPSGPVHAITQTPDGYLWIGTDKGLVRFDGINFRAFPITPNIADPNTPVLGLTTDGDGSLLIQPQGLGMLRYRKGIFETVETGLIASVSQVTAMFRERDGGVVFADLLAGTLRLRNEKVSQVIPDGVAGTAPVMSLTGSPNGRIWLGTLNSGLFSEYEGKVARVGDEIIRQKINCLLPLGDNEVLLGTDSGAVHWDGTKFVHLELPKTFDGIQILTLLKDRDANIWIGTARGLLRMSGKTTSGWDEGQFPIGAINALFEDREGNIWVGGTRGLERLRDSAFLTYSTEVGMPSDRGGPVYVDAENRTWFAPVEGGLYVLSEGKVQAIKVAGLGTDVVYSITGGSNGAIWIGRQRGGITRVRFDNGIVTDQTYTEVNGLAQNSVYSVYQTHEGAIWAGTLSGGVSRLEHEQFVTYKSTNGLGSNTVASILESKDGTMWFGTSNGLSALSNGEWKTYKKTDGLLSDSVNCLHQDSSGVLWIGTSAGLAFFQSGQLQVLQGAPASLQEEIFGIAEDKNQWLWVATSHHILRLSQKLSGSARQVTDVREYLQADGLLSLQGVKRSVSVFRDSLGKVWFSLDRGLSVVAPDNITKSSVPALVSIESIVADGKNVPLSDKTRIPPSPQRVIVNYAGLSFAVPEHVRFRYMLDGFEHQWSEPVAAREAIYTNLSPGTYRFRIVASNSDGTWNGEEQSYTFKVLPAFWQTWWFRILCFAIVCSLVLAIYQFRLREATHQLNVRFEERLAERTRIAQELHDTLLQGVLSASMQLNVANDQMEANAPFKPLVTRVLELMGRVVDDGRSAVRGLRVSREGTQALDQAFSRVPQELAVQGNAAFRVVVEGPQRLLHPVIRDEVYRIGREAVVNAFRHAEANSIEVEIEYAPHELIVRVLDNGRGIDPQIVQVGREGHWGLSGMRERAGKIGAKLKILSKTEGGTEVELRVPARIAFDSQNSDSKTGWLARMSSRKK